MEEVVRALVVQSVRWSAVKRKVGGWGPPRNVVFVFFLIFIVCLSRPGFALNRFYPRFSSKSTAFVAFQ